MKKVIKNYFDYITFIFQYFSPYFALKSQLYGSATRIAMGSVLAKASTVECTAP